MGLESHDRIKDNKKKHKQNQAQRGQQTDGSKQTDGSRKSSRGWKWKIAKWGESGGEDDESRAGQDRVA